MKAYSPKHGNAKIPLVFGGGDFFVVPFCIYEFLSIKGMNCLFGDFIARVYTLITFTQIIMHSFLSLLLLKMVTKWYQKSQSFQTAEGKIDPPDFCSAWTYFNLSTYLKCK